MPDDVNAWRDDRAHGQGVLNARIGTLLDALDSERARAEKFAADMAGLLIDFVPVEVVATRAYDHVGGQVSGNHCPACVGMQTHDERAPGRCPGGVG